MLYRGDQAREQIDRIRHLLARRSICHLGARTVPKYVASWHHEATARAMEQVILWAQYGGRRGGIPRLLVSQPPQHGKSTGVELAAALALGQDPDLTVMGTAYNSQRATQQAESTKKIMKSPEYLATFSTRVGTQYDPNTRRAVSVKDQSSYYRTLREHSDGSFTPADGYFYAAGIQAGLTGVGFRLGIMDDWVKDEQAAISAASKLHRIGTYTKGFESRQQGNAGIISIGTMWDNPDWLHWLFDLWTEQGHDPVWLRYPALTDDTASYPLTPEDPRSEGSEESLWEARFPAESQKQKRNGLVTVDRNAWYAIQQQNPQRISGALFPEQAWQWFAVTGAHAFDLRQFDDIHLSIDGNVKETGASFAVIGAYGTMTRRGVKHYFRLDESRGHYEFSMLRDETLRLWNKWRTAYPSLVAKGRCWVEDKANGPALMSQLAGHGIPFTAVPKVRSKMSCMRMAELPLLEGRCWLPVDSDGMVSNDWVKGEQGFVKELSGQPQEPDDRADEFSQMIICNDPNLGIKILSMR